MTEPGLSGGGEPSGSDAMSKAGTGAVSEILSSDKAYNPYGTFGIAAPAAYVGSPSKSTFNAQVLTVMMERNIPRVKTLTTEDQVTEHGYGYIKGKLVTAGRYDNVRRPMRGIQIKEDTYTLLTIESADGTRIIETPNTSAALGHGSPYSNFIIQQVVERMEEKFSVLETFGENFAFFMGEKSRLFEFSGTLINTEDFPWKAEWLSNYQGFFRGTRVAEQRARVVLEFDQEVLKGFLLGTQIVHTSVHQHKVDFSFTMLVLDHYTLEDVRMTEFPHYNVPLGFNFESELYQNKYESLTFQVRKGILGMDNDSEGGLANLGFLSMFNVDQMWRLAKGALANYPAVINNILYQQVQNVLYGRHYRAPRGGYSLEDLDLGLVSHSLQSVMSSDSSAAGLIGAVSSLVGGAEGKDYTVQDLMQPIWTSSLITSVFHSIIPANISRLASGNLDIGKNFFGYPGTMAQVFGPIRFNYDEYPGRKPLGSFDGINAEYLKQISDEYDVSMFETIYDMSWTLTKADPEGIEGSEADIKNAAAKSLKFYTPYQDAMNTPQGELDDQFLLEVLLHGGLVSSGAGFMKINNTSSVWSTGVHFLRRMWGDAQLDPSHGVNKLVAELGSWGEYAAELSRTALSFGWEIQSDGQKLKISSVDAPSAYRKDSLNDYSGAYTYKVKTRQTIAVEDINVADMQEGMDKFGINLDAPWATPWVPDVVKRYKHGTMYFEDNADVLPSTFNPVSQFYAEDTFDGNINNINNSAQFYKEEMSASAPTFGAGTKFFSEDVFSGNVIVFFSPTNFVPEDMPGAPNVFGSPTNFFAEETSPDEVPTYNPYEA